MNRSLLTYLSQSCGKHPDNIAIKYKTTTLSYRELDQKSSQLASLLVHSGLTPGERVAIYLDKTPEAIVSIFGVLKAGSCYVPLDPTAPEQRLGLIADDCTLQWLITSESKLQFAQALTASTKTLDNIVVVDADRPDIESNHADVSVYYRDDLEQASISGDEVAKQVDQHDLAYILYTSGSTGRPKGVMINHAAACAFVDWAQKTFQIECTDVLSAHAPLHFDLSIFDIFAAVASGATICLVPQGWSTFPKTIVDFIVKNGITTWYSVPTALVQLVMYGELEQRDFPDLKRILFAGEVFPSKYLGQLMQLLPGVDYFNLYGPTETNVISYHQIEDAPEAEMDVPIGILCDGVTGYVVSEAEVLASPGEIGELYVTGPTLMEGYWRDEQNTGKELIKNPFEPQDEGLVYKTGDLVHLDANGLLIYHGRSDTMVKSRGYRIELGEIETILSAHAKIRESVVTALPSGQFGTTIAAVIVAVESGDLDEEDVHHLCREKLPAYMVPEKIRFVSALPRTSTGKIDRLAVAELSR